MRLTRKLSSRLSSKVHWAHKYTIPVESYARLVRAVCRKSVFAQASKSIKIGLLLSLRSVVEKSIDRVITMHYLLWVQFYDQRVCQVM